MDANNLSIAPEREVRFDIVRSIVLAEYIKNWGVPMIRFGISNNGIGSQIEVYTFPANYKKPVQHIATVGVSELKNARGSTYDCEYFFALPEDLGGALIDDVVGYLFDLSIHFLKLDAHEVPRVMSESPRAPAQWKTRSILVDEARTEAESLGALQFGDDKVISVSWLVPIYQSEVQYIIDHNIECFDKLDQTSEISLADINRPSLV